VEGAEAVSESGAPTTCDDVLERPLRAALIESEFPVELRALLLAVADVDRRVMLKLTTLPPLELGRLQ
jgi:hypothetical protein